MLVAISAYQPSFEVAMTTRPQSVRRRERKIRRRTLYVAVLALSSLVVGAVLAAISVGVWPWIFVTFGVVLAFGELVLVPRLLRAREQLATVEALRREQLRAHAAQRDAMALAFKPTATTER
jgi:MFS family permease